MGQISVEIVAATSEDIAAVLALEQGSAEAPHWPATTYAAIVAGTEGPLQRCLWVAKGEGRLMGFAVGRVLAEVAELESIAVHSTARRSGVGRALCSAVIAWAWSHGATAVELEVRASSAGAIALYKGLGFIPTGKRPAYYAAPADDALLMYLPRPA